MTKKALLVLEASLLTSAIIALGMNAPIVATGFGIGAGLVVVAQKWRQ